MIIKNEKVCECNLLKEDNEGFDKCDDFYNFQLLVEENFLFKKITGEKSLQGEEPVEHESWFQCSKCGAKWCLVMPDVPYYLGNWIKAIWR